MIFADSCSDIYSSSKSEPSCSANPEPLLNSHSLRHRPVSQYGQSLPHPPGLRVLLSKFGLGPNRHSDQMIRFYYLTTSWTQQRNCLFVVLVLKETWILGNWSRFFLEAFTASGPFWDFAGGLSLRWALDVSPEKSGFWFSFILDSVRCAGP